MHRSWRLSASHHLRGSWLLDHRWVTAGLEPQSIKVDQKRAHHVTPFLNIHFAILFHSLCCKASFYNVLQSSTYPTPAPFACCLSNLLFLLDHNVPATLVFMVFFLIHQAHLSLRHIASAFLYPRTLCRYPQTSLSFLLQVFAQVSPSQRGPPNHPT